MLPNTDGLDFTTDQNGTVSWRVSQPVYSNLITSVSYDWDTGLVPLPIAKDAQQGDVTAALVNLYARQQRKIVSWTVQCKGRLPTVPSPTPADPNCIYLRSQTVISAPILICNGNFYEYAISGIYYYAMLVPVDPEFYGMASAKTPMDATPVAEMTIPPSIFDNSLIG